MILTPQIHGQIIAAIQREPKKALLLPPFCYWRGRDQPVVYVDELPETLSHVLYRELIGPLEYGQTLVLRPGVPKRNVNPYLFIPTAPGRRTGDVCRNGHPYAGNEMPDNTRKYRCRLCYRAALERKRNHRKSVSEINREKTVCDNGHPLSGDNVRITRGGRRRCRQCHRENMARYRASQSRKEVPNVPRHDNHQPPG